MRGRDLIHNSRIDTSPRIFMGKMKVEILLLLSGIIFACSNYFKKYISDIKSSLIFLLLW